MFRALTFTAAIALGTWALSGEAEAFHGHRACGGGYGYRVPVTAYYAPSAYRGYYGGGSMYSSGYRGYSNPGYGYGYGGYGVSPYGYSGYRTGGISIGIGSGMGYGGYGNSGFGGYGYPGYGYGW